VKYVTRSVQGLWGIYAWLVFLICALAALIVVTLVPGTRARQRFVTGASRAVFRLAGVDVTVEGLERLPPGQAVVVANHASYVDGPLLKGFLPAHFAFVIKGEMREVPIAHFLLRRGGCYFVERNTTQGSARDARQIVKAAEGGESLAFFPEGTFRKITGIGRFRPGAFVAATRNKLPVVPIAINGTRHMLPSGRLVPRPCRLHIRVLEPIPADAPEYGDPRALAERARQEIAAATGERALEDIREAA
jgi:1-acyl-sn-glycerol-3-phosphate acyltransferase